MPVSATRSERWQQSGKRIAGSADGVGIGRPPTPNATSAVQERIQRSGRPLVVAIDEAHRLDSKVGEALLNAVQAISGNTKAAIALLAGTPDLVDHVRRMNAPFFLNRAGEGLLPIGLISDDEAVRAVAEPLRAAGLDVDSNAEQTIRECCRGYPYFTQVLGRVIAESPGLVSGSPVPLGKPGDSASEETLNRFLERRNRHYEGLWADLRDAKVISCGYLLGNVQSDSPNGVMPDYRVEQAIDLGLAHPYEKTARAPDHEEAKHRLRQLGLLWSPGEAAGTSELGIPSFFDYLRQQVRRLKPKLASRLDATTPFRP